jgi:proteic killer suppression protein
VPIKSFKHKGVEHFYRTESKAGIQAAHSSKLKRLLARLDVSTKPEDMNLPGFGLHGLKGEQAGRYAVSVNGNWRLTFEFEGTDAILLDYEDYH